jgi:predicted nucleic acid-binding protein
MPTVSNTSPISNLACISRLDLVLEQFSEVWIPHAVEVELGSVPDAVARKSIDNAKRAGWLKSRPATDSNLISLLMVELHKGEAEAIALALELKADRLLIDEREGRAMARQLGLKLTGVLGVLLRAKRMNRITTIKPEIEALRAKAHFFISPTLEAAILKKAGE